MAGGAVCRPYGRDVVNPGGASGRPRPTKGSAGGSGPRPCGGVWIKNGGRTMCAPTGEEAGTCPLIRLLWGHLSLSPLSLRDISP